MQLLPGRLKAVQGALTEYQVKSMSETCFLFCFGQSLKLCTVTSSAISGFLSWLSFLKVKVTLIQSISNLLSPMLSLSVSVPFPLPPVKSHSHLFYPISFLFLPFLHLPLLWYPGFPSFFLLFDPWCQYVTYGLLILQIRGFAAAMRGFICVTLHAVQTYI